MPLRNQNAISFLATANAMKSRAFFEKALGLEFVEETDFALVFATQNGFLRIQKLSIVSPQSYTSMGWQVDDIEKVAMKLRDNGIVFDRHEGLQQDAHGVWASPSGAKIAWFKDPDGNILSITQH